MMRWPNTLWRALSATIAAMAGACLYCAAVSPETVLFGTVIGPFAAISVILFLLLEHLCCEPFSKHLGFFLPVLVIAGVSGYQIRSLQLQVAQEGLSDGGLEMLIYFIQCYSVGVGCAFASLLLVPTSPHNDAQMEREK